MKTDYKTSDREPSPAPNEIGLLAWSLLAHSNLDAQLNMVGGGIPGQPDPDVPFQQPSEPGEPTIPDEPPPAPVA
jgi:hypothetical protein